MCKFFSEVVNLAKFALPKKIYEDFLSCAINAHVFFIAVKKHGRENDNVYNNLSNRDTRTEFDNLENFYKKMTTTTIMNIKKELIELNMRSERKNDDSSNGDFGDFGVRARTPQHGQRKYRNYRKRTPMRYQDTYYYWHGDRISKSSDDDQFTENEASESTCGRKFDSDIETSLSELTNKVENKRDRYKDRHRSPQYESRCHSPQYTSKRRSPRYNDRRSPSYDDRRVSRFRPEKGEADRKTEEFFRRSPSYDDRQSSSVSRYHHVTDETERRTDGNRNEKRITRDNSYSDSWAKQDRNIGVANTMQLMPESDSKDPLINLLRTRIKSMITKSENDEPMGDKTSELVNDQNNYDELTSNDEHTSQNLTNLRSKLSALMKTVKPTSTVTSNEQTSKHSTNEGFNIDDEIINRVVARPINITANASGNVVGQVTFDESSFKQNLANFQTDERMAFTYNPDAQTDAHSRPYCPLSHCSSCNTSVRGYEQIPKPVLLPKPKARVLPTMPPDILSTPPPPGMLFIPPPNMLSTPPPSTSFQQPRQMPILQPRQQPNSKPMLLPPPRPGLLSTPKLAQHTILNPYLQQPQQPSFVRDRRVSLSSNPINSSPGAHYQTSAYPEYNQNVSINARRPTAFYQSNKAPMNYGEYKRLQGTVASTTGKVHYNKAVAPSNIVNGGSNSDFGFHRSDNNSMSIPKVNPMFSQRNFKIPKISRVPNTVQIISDWDVTPESVKKQSNLRENADFERNDYDKEIANEDGQEPEIRNDKGKNQLTEQENNVATDSSSVDNQSTEVNAETIMRGVKNANNLLVLVDIMGKLSENNTLAKVKEILQNCANGGESVSNQEIYRNVATHVEVTDESKTTKKKHKNELDKLNEDINDTFIRSAVLSASGRRNSTQCNKSDAKNVDTTSEQERESTLPTDDMDIPNEHLPEPTNIQRSKSTPLQTRKLTKKKSTKLVKKPAKTVKKPPKAPKESAKSTDKRNIPSGLKNSSVKGKRSHDIVDDKEPAPKKAKKTFVAQKPAVKNNNVEWHSLKKVLGCKLCDKPCTLSVISHYVNVHPNSEVITSRLAPEALECLLNPSLIEKCEPIKHPRNCGGFCYKFKQFCYFCNDYKCMTKSWWIDHMAVHTGYYQYECVHCDRKFATRPFNHKVKENHQVEKISQSHFQKKILQGYICKLCNFVRFTKREIETHLSNEHDDEENTTKKFKVFVFLNFTKEEQKRKVKEVDVGDVDGQDERLVAESDESDFEGYESDYLRKERRKLYGKSFEEESETEYESDEELEVETVKR